MVVQTKPIKQEKQEKESTNLPLKGKVYGSYGHTGEANWLLPLGLELTSNIEDADVVVFGGGKDVDPGFYGEKRGSNTDRPSERDRREKEDFEYVQTVRKAGKDVKMVGICRGAQLLTALSGGRLIQHVGNHMGTHSLSTFDRRTLQVNSIHHQMVFPYRMSRSDYKILGWSTKNLSPKYLNGWDKSMWLPSGFKEIEVIYYPKTGALGFQYHPEMMFRNANFKESVKWGQDLFIKFYNNEL